MQDKIDEMFKKVGDWGAKIAIHPINSIPISCNDIAAIDGSMLNALSLDKFEDLINKMCSYNIYIKSQKSSVEAQIEIMQSELNRALYLETNNLGADYRYKNIEEKIAIVRTIKPEIDELFRKITTVKAQFIRIKDIPFSIDKKIEILRTIYARRINEQQPNKHQS